MQIVIEIDDEQVLFDIKNRGLYGENETELVILKALYNGIPLPKGHGDLIDRKELIDSNLCKTFGLRQVDIENAPTIIKADKEK